MTRGAGVIKVHVKGKSIPFRPVVAGDRSEQLEDRIARGMAGRTVHRGCSEEEPPPGPLVPPRVRGVLLDVAMAWVALGAVDQDGLV